MITKDRLKQDFLKLGLGKGDWLLIHSSLKSIGYVKGGPATVVDAILDVLGPHGLLMVPTFTFTNYKPYFDPEQTPSQMGIITETVRKEYHCFRSLHPRHSVGALGEGAESVVQGHLQAGSVGKGSPLDKLSKRGGYVLLLGVKHDVNTMIHAAEVRADLPYLYSVKESPDFPEAAWVKSAHAGMIEVPLAPYPTCSQGFGKLEPIMHARGQLRYGNVGKAEVQLMKGRDVIDTGAAVLRGDPEALLCDRPNCYPCLQKRKFMARQREEEAMCLQQERIE
jgi:aminoglycoside 3-N-acetyltransferase